MDKTILVGDNLRYPGGPFHIGRRYMNGILIGQAGHCYLAAFNGALKDSVAMRPVVGALNARSGLGWVWPVWRSTDPIPFTLLSWYDALRRPRTLAWRVWLRQVLPDEDMVKLAIEDYSLDDLTILRDRAWYVGRSLHAPLWRVYALVPARLWEQTGAMPSFEGQVRSVKRFGAIYDSRVHQLAWK